MRDGEPVETMLEVFLALAEDRDLTAAAHEVVGDVGEVIDPLLRGEARDAAEDRRVAVDRLIETELPA